MQYQYDDEQDLIPLEDLLHEDERAVMDDFADPIDDLIDEDPAAYEAFLHDLAEDEED